MSLRQSLPSEGKQMIESVRRIKHVQLKRKEVHHTEAWFFFFFSVTVDGTNTLELIHVSENMLVTYVENYDGERITKMTEGLGKYCSLCRWAPTISTFTLRREVQTPYDRSSLVAQMGKNPHPMWETWVWSLGREDPMEEGITTHSSILAWKIPMDRGAWRATVHVVTHSSQDMTQNSIYCPSGGTTGPCLCFMTTLLLLGLFWLFPFAFPHSHFSDLTYSLTEIFHSQKAGQRQGGQGTQGPVPSH